MRSLEIGDSIISSCTLLPKRAVVLGLAPPRTTKLSPLAMTTNHHIKSHQLSIFACHFRVGVSELLQSSHDGVNGSRGS